MPHQLNRLSALRIKQLTTPGRYGDGGGLYLQVHGGGQRSWVFRYRDRTTGKHRDKGLGPVWDVPLAEARQAAAHCRSQLRQGIDPIDHARKAASERKLQVARQRTFGDCVDDYLKSHRDGWRSAKHADQWRNTLDTYAADLLTLPVTRIDTDLVLDALQPIWSSKTETATRVRQRIETILDWATARKYRSGENPARWRGHLDKLLPKPGKLKAVEHRAALPYSELPAFYVQLGKRNGLAARALQLQILTASRPGEVVAAQWSEIDLDHGVWTIPATRMKAGREHRVALSPEAVAMLRALARVNEYVFPGAGKQPCLSTASMLQLAKELKPGLTVHGFRSSFRDWAAEVSTHSREAAEAALAHVIKDKAEAAYQRGDLFQKRMHLMTDWAKFCASGH